MAQEGPLEKGMAARCSVLAWRIPGTEEPNRLQSMGLQRVGHDLTTFQNNNKYNKSFNYCYSPYCSSSVCGRIRMKIAVTQGIIVPDSFFLPFFLFLIFYSISLSLPMTPINYFTIHIYLVCTKGQTPCSILGLSVINSPQSLADH